MLLAFLSSVIIASGVGPGYVGKPVTSTPYYVCTNDARSYLNLRAEPDPNSRIIGKLPYSTPIKSFSDRVTGTDGYYWGYIKLPSTGKKIEGWVRYDYFCYYK